jgi:MFS family permease
MVVLDLAIVNVAIPAMQTDLGLAQSDLQWVATTYGLLFGGFLLVGGRAADLVATGVVWLALTPDGRPQILWVDLDSPTHNLRLTTCSSTDCR